MITAEVALAVHAMADSMVVVDATQMMMVLDQLNEFDQFYRVVCYPLHCLTAKSFFDELDFQWTRYDYEVKHPRNS